MYIIILIYIYNYTYMYNFIECGKPNKIRSISYIKPSQVWRMNVRDSHFQVAWAIWRWFLWTTRSEALPWWIPCSAAFPCGTRFPCLIGKPGGKIMKNGGMGWVSGCVCQSESVAFFHHTYSNCYPMNTIFIWAPKTPTHWRFGDDRRWIGHCLFFGVTQL